MHTPQGRRSGIPQSLENKGKLRQLVDKLEFIDLENSDFYSKGGMVS